MKEFPSPILPKNKTIVDVFADFLQYLLRCTRQCIIETQANGEAVWNSVSPHIKFVLTHPNGYEGAQQETMKLAAIRGGLIPNSDAGRSRITFVTEGEASFNYCATSNLSADAFKVGYKGNLTFSFHSISIGEPKNLGHRCRWRHRGYQRLFGYFKFSTNCGRNFLARMFSDFSISSIIWLISISSSGLLQGSEFVTFRARDYIQGNTPKSPLNVFSKSQRNCGRQSSIQMKTFAT